MDVIVFISIFLGLISGRQWIEMRVDPAVKSVRLTYEGRELAFIRKAPFQTAADFGSELTPGELVATGYDERGEEIARASQYLNVPRSIAEVQIVPVKEGSAVTAVRLVWHHREASVPKRADIWFDAEKLKVDRNFTAKLSRFDALHSHVVAAEMKFKDGVVARGDLVIHGGFFDATSSQLTPVAMNRVPEAASGTLDECFNLGVQRVRATDAATDAIVYIVKDPDPSEARSVLDPAGLMNRRRGAGTTLKRELPLDAGTKVEIVWPVAMRIEREGEPTTKLYQRTEPTPGGMRWLLAFPVRRKGTVEPEFAEAVAVAGLRAMASGRRRAVILLLSSAEDASRRKPAVVRRYLESIGVPLFVWSLTGARPDLAESWGRVDDISTSTGLAEATDRVRKTLASQQIVWLSLDPVKALRIDADPQCGLQPLARLAR